MTTHNIYSYNQIYKEPNSGQNMPRYYSTNITGALLQKILHQENNAMAAAPLISLWMHSALDWLQMLPKQVWHIDI